MRERPIESLDDAMADGADPRPQGPRRLHAWGLAVQTPRYPRASAVERDGNRSVPGPWMYFPYHPLRTELTALVR